ncbi:MAG: alpha/beta hydrolase [Planctomycetota bacterium]|jgi:acetyl esterase/lipase|nr:MAG: alpha/beta hydrolase [Planctomycetota bacterium]
MNKRLSAVVMPILLTAIGCVGAEVVAAAEPVGEIRLWPEGVPGDRVPSDPAEKVEKGKDDIQRRSFVSDPRLIVHPLPQGDGGPRPAVIILPGGGYNILADDHEGGEIGRFLNGHGIVALTLLYRVPTGAFAEPDAGPVMDAQKAVSIVRERAGELGIDPSRIGLMGFSAGGHTALVAATTKASFPGADASPSARPDCTILIYPWRVLAAEGKQLWPGVMIDAATTPMFIAQTADDTASPAKGAVALFSALLDAKVPAELHVYERGGHGYGLRRREQAPGTGDWPARLVDWLGGRGFTHP